MLFIDRNSQQLTPLSSNLRSHCRSILLQIGNIKVGSEHPIALQTMTTTDTRDVDGTVDQVSKSQTLCYALNYHNLTVMGTSVAESSH